MYLEEILDEVLPGETGAARMQQIALFTLIFALQNTGESVTASRIAALTGQTYSQIHHHVQKLMKLDIVERTRVPNRLGRGQAWHLSIKQTPKTQKLLDAMRGK
jgi:DNA-binding MarR family transcriptional regulator